MIFAPALLILKSGQKGKLIVAKDANKVGIAGVPLQDDSEGHLRPCAYMAWILKNAETIYIAYDKEAMAMVEVVSTLESILEISPRL